MDSHEIVGSVMLGEKDPVSVKIDVDIESDNRFCQVVGRWKHLSKIGRQESKFIFGKG